MTDPMAGYDQAEAEAVARTDEARREQHYTEVKAHVVKALNLMRELQWSTYECIRKVVDIAEDRNDERYAGPSSRHIQAFSSDYGTPALLRVLADALEASRASR